MLKISKENFYKNINNRESWNWHTSKHKREKSWRKERDRIMKKYDAVKGLPREEKAEPDYDSDDYVYIRKEDLPKIPRPADYCSP